MAFCIPNRSGVPGSLAQFDWWNGAVSGSDPRYSPDNPDWLGAFNLSEGGGANIDVQFRALQGAATGGIFLFLSWVIRAASLDVNIDRLNCVIGDGTNYVAVQIMLGTTSATTAGAQNTGIFSYFVRKCSLSGTALSETGIAASDGVTGLESTGRMWVDFTAPTRQLHSAWAFQMAIPLGAAWNLGASLPAPTVTVPAAGAFKLWYEVWSSLPGRAVPYVSKPGSPMTSSVADIIPAGLLTTHMLDLATGGVCDQGVTLNWGQVGVRNVSAGDPPRSGTTEVRLDLGQNFPPNKAEPAQGGTPYNVNHTPNVSNSKFQNQFYAQPSVPAGTEASKLRARFSLANWGSQITVGTGSSWRPIPGGENVLYQIPNSEARFVWPLPGPGGTADSFTTTLVRNINRYLNAVGVGGAPPAGSQHPHQCVLVELSATDPAVVITRSSIYQNMNIARASVFSELAEISVVGLDPINTLPRDVFLYVQAFNMPQYVKPDDDLQRRVLSAEDISLVAAGRSQLREVEDIAAVYPTYIVHAYHDTGKKLKLRNGSLVPILRPQTAFGYFALHEGNLVGWETRLNGAERIADHFYHLGVPNNGSKYIEIAIQARESDSEAPLPPEKSAPPTTGGGCLAAIMKLLSGK